MKRRTASSLLITAALSGPLAGCAMLPVETNGTGAEPNVTIFNRTEDSQEITVTATRISTEDPIYKDSKSVSGSQTWEFPGDIEPGEYRLVVNVKHGLEEGYVWRARENHGLDIMVSEDDISFEEWVN